MADLPRAMSAAQRAFVDSAESAGAVRADRALLLAELPRLTNRELDDLVDSGLVREAAEGRFYLFRPRRAAAQAWDSSPDRTASRPRTTGRFLRLLIFWILVILILVLLLNFSAR